MKTITNSRRLLGVLRFLPQAAVLTVMGLAGIALTVAACGAGSGGSPPLASAHTTAEQTATLHWLSETNQMWTRNNLAGLDQVTTAGMRTIYLAESVIRDCRPTRPGWASS